MYNPFCGPVEELDSWDLNLDVTECALLETGAAVPGAEQVHVGHAIAGPQSSEPIVIKAQRGANRESLTDKTG